MRVVGFVVLLLVAVSVQGHFLRTDTRTGALPKQSAPDACAQHSLCGACLQQENTCVWCADGAGSCVQGDVTTGPSDVKTCKNWEGSYCTNEPCAQYTGCEACTSDAFCGWSVDEKTCVEGDKKGPLTGKTKNWLWDTCAAAAAGGSGPAAPVVAPKISTVVSSTEKVAEVEMNKTEDKVKTVEDEEKKVIGMEKELLGKSKGNFNVIEGFRDMFSEFKLRKTAINEAEEHDKEMFLQAFGDMTKERKNDYEQLLSAYNNMETNFARDQAVLVKRDVQMKKFATARTNEDVTVNQTGKTLDHANGTSYNSSKFNSMLKKLGEKFDTYKLEKFVNNLDADGKKFVNTIHKKSVQSVNKELHRAALRMEERSEASGYACQFLLCHPDTECRDFPTMYSGTILRISEALLSREEQVRVCNSVHSQLDRHPKKPKYAGEGCLENSVAQDYLKWCINNVHT